MHYAEVGWPPATQTVKRRGQATAADLISVAGYSLWAAPTTYRGSMFSSTFVRRTAVSRDTAP
jgi:hypothetical protein